MNKIAILGNRGTFCEVAAEIYAKKGGSESEIIYCKTLNSVFDRLDSECQLGVLPIENTLDGFVQRTIDLLIKNNASIIGEVILPVHFSFLANSMDTTKVNKVYCQFKAQGQCLKFLDGLDSVKIITTESNSDSFEQVKMGAETEAAIIPQHLLVKKDFPFSVKEITDSPNNETRFIIISKGKQEFDTEKKYKTSLVILDSVTKQPGMLLNILMPFKKNGINLLAIISRPTKQELGEYYFYIELEGHYLEHRIKKSLEEISIDNNVKVFGAYEADLGGNYGTII